MTTTYKLLGQVAPYIASGLSSSTWATLYTVPTGKSAIVTNIIASPTTYGESTSPFSISLVPNGQSADNTSTSLGSFYVVEPGGFAQNYSPNLNFDLCMSEGDSIQVMFDLFSRAVGDPRYPATFTAFGTEIT